MFGRRGLGCFRESLIIRAILRAGRVANGQPPTEGHFQGGSLEIRISPRGLFCSNHHDRQVPADSDHDDGRVFCLAAPLRAVQWRASPPRGRPCLRSGWTKAGSFRQRSARRVLEVCGLRRAISGSRRRFRTAFMRWTPGDPDQPYFRGQGVPTRLALGNPFADGRTILHFRVGGRPQRCGLARTLVGTHKGGYDEFGL